jgi:DNA primase
MSMVGFPNDLRTKQDWLNAVDFAKSSGETDRAIMVSKLEGLRTNTKMMVLKVSSAGVPAEEQTPEDYEEVDNPACEMIRLGLSGSQIDNLIGGLK